MARKRTVHAYTLRRASSVVFCLISLLPLLLFVYTLYALDALHQVVAQIGLASALVMSMIGFYIYSGMIAGLSAILRDLEAGDSEPAPPPAGTVVTAAVEPAPGMPAPLEARAPASPRRPGAFAARGLKGTGGRASLVVPGMGRITELKPADAAGLGDLDSMWKTEAQPLLRTRRVVGQPRAQAVALRLRQRAESLLGDAPNRGLIQVGCDDRQAIPRRQIEERLIHGEPRPAALRPLELTVECGASHAVSHGQVHLVLLVLSQHLEGEGGAGAGVQQCRQHVGLVGVVRGVVVGFSQIDNARGAGAQGHESCLGQGITIPRERAGLPRGSAADQTECGQRRQRKAAHAGVGRGPWVTTESAVWLPVAWRPPRITVKPRAPRSRTMSSRSRPAM